MVDQLNLKTKQSMPILCIQDHSYTLLRTCMQCAKIWQAQSNLVHLHSMRSGARKKPSYGGLLGSHAATLYMPTQLLHACKCRYSDRVPVTSNAQHLCAHLNRHPLPFSFKQSLALAFPMIPLIPSSISMHCQPSGKSYQAVHDYVELSQ